MAPLPNFTIDVHSHPIPDFFREALLDSGFAVQKGEMLIVDGFPTPAWTLDSYLKNREQFNYDYSVMSITAPGVNFLSGTDAAVKLARRLNNQMAEWTKAHPSKLGAFGVLPLMNIEASLKEIEYCLDVLHFDGIGLYTNYNGIYLGDPRIDPIMEALNRRKVGCLVHPVAPSPAPNMLNLSSPAIEYTFDSTRAITNMLATGAAEKFPDVKLIFSHGGGTVPYLADRIAGQLSMPFQGGRRVGQTMGLMKNFYYDLAACGGEAQLSALSKFVDPSRILIGSDVPYFPDMGLPIVQKGIYGFSGFSKEHLVKIRHGNALEVFPGIAKKISP